MANVFTRVPAFFREVRVELTKVSWPTRKDLLGATRIVILTTALLTIFIAIVDFVLTWVIKKAF
ncbi:MAG: preprotein translocase subunit SecE [Candidatus Omnitrophota bacterium]